MERQEFIDRWSGRVGWFLELLDHLLAAITIILAVVVVVFILLGWNNIGGLVLALVAGLALFFFGFYRIAWLFSITVGLFLVVVAGLFLGLVSTLIYGANDNG